MKRIILYYLILFSGTLYAQEETDKSKFYLGASYGSSFSIGDFGDTDIDNFNAGFAANGKKFDEYGGYYLNGTWTATANIRYQSFETELEDAIDQYQSENPSTVFSASSGNWETYYFLVGVAYKMNLTKRFAIYPRVAVGPMWATNPGVTITSESSTSNQNYSRSSETGLGVGGEVGIGLMKDLGKHFSLMPTFTFSGGTVNYSNVVTTKNNVNVINNYKPVIQSFTFGLSVAYKFY